MDYRKFTFDMILKYLGDKNKITELEQDLILSIKELKKCPTNRQSLINKIKENNLKYADVQMQIMMQPGIVMVAFEKITDDGLRNSLSMQIQYMWLEEVRQLNHRDVSNLQS